MSARPSLRTDGPRKAGDTIPCVNCGGKGYVLRGWGDRYPIECRSCLGSGTQTIRKPTW